MEAQEEAVRDFHISFLYDAQEKAKLNEGVLLYEAQEEANLVRELSCMKPKKRHRVSMAWL